MSECTDCEYRGYSPEFCRVHIKSCKRNEGVERKPTPAYVKVGAKVLAGAGIGVATVALGSAAVSLVGGAVVLHAVLIKLGAGAGLAGGGIGLYKGLAANNEDSESD